LPNFSFPSIWTDLMKFFSNGFLLILPIVRKFTFDWYVSVSDDACMSEMWVFYGVSGSGNSPSKIESPWCEFFCHFRHGYEFPEQSNNKVRELWSYGSLFHGSPDSKCRWAGDFVLLLLQLQASMAWGVITNRSFVHIIRQFLGEIRKLYQRWFREKLQYSGRNCVIRSCPDMFVLTSSSFQVDLFAINSSSDSYFDFLNLVLMGNEFAVTRIFQGDIHRRTVMLTLVLVVGVKNKISLNVFSWKKSNCWCREKAVSEM
jgi:hypothetical protein